ncbi:hypothetical protein K488DRAFT_84216 [Vararia minispora EC-137]|uniref:Uncharacterized protein n=1 Tax=Vararia minispora EC-137 TaxID=1314806 RepID=A0ACB8QRE2_9AGAM|nr:hypothetical protein K488DRAFT_84216 [Vararia minispora EC-137]
MSNLSSDDQATLQQTGEDINHTFIAIVVETFLYGTCPLAAMVDRSICVAAADFGRDAATYACLVVIASRALLTSVRRATLALFAVVVTMFAFDTVLWINDIHDLTLEVSAVLTSKTNDTLQDRYQRAIDGSIFPLDPIFYTLMTVFGDTIIIWRAFAFWKGPRERWLLVLPLAVWLASIITMIMIIDCSVQSKSNLLLGNFDSSGFCQRSQNASYLATTLTTLVATVMIAYKSWEYRRTIGSQLSEESSRVRLERVMIILVESGTLYFLFFLEIFISSLGNLTQLEDATPSLALASTIHTYTTSHIVGIYPTIVVILVHYHKSYIEATTMGTSIGFAHSGAGGGTTTTGTTMSMFENGHHIALPAGQSHGQELERASSSGWKEPESWQAKEESGGKQEGSESSPERSPQMV